jgi:phosphotransferase system enzyme I (PtsP)
MNNKVLHILKEITSLFAYSKDNSKILPKIVKILATTLNCDVCSIYAYDDKKKKLVLSATYGLNPEITGKFELPPDKGITGYAFSRDEIINIVNPENDSRFVHAANSGEEKYKSMLSCPLTVGGRKTGALNLQSSEPVLFENDVIEIIKALSPQIANIIESTKIFSTISAIQKDENSHEPTTTRKQKILKGIQANQGICAGTVIILDRRDEFNQIPAEKHNSETRELLLLQHALRMARQETVEMENKALSMISEADAAIFNVHLIFLEDQTLISKIQSIIKDGFCAEYAVKTVCAEHIAKFAELKSEIFREKSADLKDVMLHLIKAVRKIKGNQSYDKDYSAKTGEKYIVAAHELLPSDILRAPISNVAGYLCEKGGATAHFAILAKALNIPAMMGVRELMSSVAEGDKIILDAYSGNIYVNPASATENHFIELIKFRSEKPIEPDYDKALTMDGELVDVKANISLLSELPIFAKSGADGIGLYRTEFMFIVRDSPPSEDAQREIYSKISAACPENEITFRLLDAGSDKALPYLNFPDEDNPALGWRGIRMLLENENILKTQISAILQAGAGRKIKLAAPMISTHNEILRLKKIIADAAETLSSKKIPIAENPKLGIMIEVPSAIFSLDKILPLIDFASIGTNDLMQFFFAADRTNEKVSSVLSFYHPAFLKILNQIGGAFSSADKRLAVCGEMASEPKALPLLIGIGARELSASPRKIPELKKTIRKISAEKAGTFLKNCLLLDNPQDVENACAKFLSTLVN